MKLTNETPNYCATVVRIERLDNLDGLDRLKSVPANGLNALVSVDHKVGELGLFFNAGCKLSHEFCHYNNLYRDSALNVDTEQSGYIEKGRVRTIRLKGNESTGLWIPLSSLSYLSCDLSQLKEQDRFTHLDQVKIVEKYILNPQVAKAGGKDKAKKKKKWERVDKHIFPEHTKTTHFSNVFSTIDPEQEVIVTNKLHGTSGRFGHVKVNTTLWEKIKWFFGFKVPSYEYIAGSRTVIKNKDNSDNGYYDSDLWTMHLNRIKRFIPKDYIFYGEIIGWTENGSAIQKNYSYSVEEGQSRLYIYRITKNGVDLSWDDMKSMISAINAFGLRSDTEALLHGSVELVPEMWRGKFKDLDPDSFLNIRFHDEGYHNCPPLDVEGIVDEGVCIRLEGDKPLILKHKSPKFLFHEDKMMDQGVEDIEESN